MSGSSSSSSAYTQQQQEQLAALRAEADAAVRVSRRAERE